MRKWEHPALPALVFWVKWRRLLSKGRYRFMTVVQIGELIGGGLVIAGIALLSCGQPHRLVQVKDVPGLVSAIDHVQNGDEIVLADGVYQLKRFLWLENAKNIVLRSASQDPKKAVLRGQGFYKRIKNNDILWIQACTNVTVEALSFEEAQDFGIKIYAQTKPRNINILNCRFLNIGVRHIKGTASSSHEMAVGGSVRNCYFENKSDKVPRSDWFNQGNYIAGIDMMCLDGWTFCDNKFVNIKGASGGGRAAIFIWVHSRNVVVERNTIIGCDRGIAFGNPSGSSNDAANHVADSICRNNFIANQADSAIELAWAKHIRVYGNTCWRPDPKGRGIRCIELVSDAKIADNLVRGKIELIAGCEGANNFSPAPTNYFVNPRKGDLHLTSFALEALGKGVNLAEVKEDFDRHPRKPKPDIGAAEYVPARAP